MALGRCREYIKLQFPNIDNDMKNYIEGIIENGIDDFENSNELYEAIGEILFELSDNKTEKDIKIVCDEIMMIIQPERKIVENKILENPMQMEDLTINYINCFNQILPNKKIENSIIDTENNEKNGTKRQQKKSKKGASSASSKTTHKIETATASQIINKKDSKSEQKGNFKTKDIRIENFDIAFGDKVLIQNANLSLVFGRRYGLVGRNGLGKTTLLKMIATKQLRIPSHITILHVEQEVVGDDTLAIDSVLECDFKRKQLLDEEEKINRLINAEGNNENSSLSIRLSEIYVELSNIDADKAPVRASIILNGLGFDKNRQQLSTKTFSGGWRMRLALARALFSKPDLLLLDEPTNMLDMKAIIWLENYLCNWPTTLLVVSHDRNFLDIVPTDILHLHSQQIDTYRGNYEQYEKTKNEKMKNQQREFEAQEQKRNHVQVFIDRFRYNANRASSVQSKIKMLEKLPELKAVEKEFEVFIKFPDVEPLSPPIIQIIDLGFKYGDKVIFKNINLGANLDSRICIVGENGAGKTTLLKLVVQMLEPSSGRISLHRNLKFGYFSQHHIDQLELNINSIELLQKNCPGSTLEEYRAQLGSFGVSGDLALQSIETLSGGQKSRVAFANMCMKRPNFLVLDEPTNHLDIESIDALGKAIVNFKGGVIVVSHDEKFIEIVCKELWVCGNQKVYCLEGGFKEYRALVEKEIAQEL